MKKILLVLVGIVVGATFLVAKDSEWPKNEAAKFTAKYAVGKILVMKKDGIPTGLLSSQKDDANNSNNAWAVLFARKKAYFPIKVRIDGTWKDKTSGGSRPNSVLEIGEILKIVDEINVGSSIDLKTETIKGHEASTKGGICGNKFVFQVENGDTFEKVDQRIQQFFDVFDKLEDINKKETVELKLGMTIEEIVALMKEPSKKVDLGDKIIYKYDDMVITFQEGKVTNIEFK